MKTTLEVKIAEPLAFAFTSPPPVLQFIAHLTLTRFSVSPHREIHLSLSQFQKNFSLFSRIRFLCGPLSLSTLRFFRGKNGSGNRFLACEYIILDSETLSFVGSLQVDTYIPYNLIPSCLSFFVFIF